MTVIPTPETGALTHPTRVGRLWIFPDGTTLPVVSGGAGDDGGTGTDGGSAGSTGTSTEPARLGDDHPLVKAHAAKKGELSTTKTALAAANQRISELENAGKSAEDKVADRIAKLEQENASARAEALRMRIAAKHKISDEDAELFLTGSDAETLEKQAKRLAEQTAERAGTERKRSQVVSGEGKTPSKNPSGDDSEMREFTRGLFGRDD